MQRIIQASETEFLSLVREAVRLELQSLNLNAQSQPQAPATRKEAAKHLGIGLTTLDVLLKNDELASFKIGNQVRITWPNIQAYLDKKK